MFLPDPFLGVPARVIGAFDDLMVRRKTYSLEMKELTKLEMSKSLWERFEATHKNCESKG